MSDIDLAIDREMGSPLQRAYIILTLCYITVDYIGAPQIMIILFAAPPDDAFRYNPHAGNDTRTIISEWNFTESQRNWIPGFLQSIFFFGFMIGTVVFGQLADKFGRWRVSWKVYTGCLVVALATGFTQNWQQMAACRFIVGFGIGGLSVVNTILRQEMCAARMWALNGALGSVAFTISSLTFLLLAYFVPSWRTLYLLSTLPALLGYIFYIVIPESPRWLFTQGKVYEAEEVVRKLSRWNGKSNPDYQLLGNESKLALDTPESTDTATRKNSILDLVAHSVLRYRTAIMSYQWFTTSFVFYCLTLGAASFSQNFYLAFGASCLGQLPAAPITFYFMNREWCGRRGTLCLLMTVCAICLFIIYILPNVDNFAHFRLILFMVAKIASEGCFLLIYVYTPELFPTVVRNVGLGSMSTAARVGSMMAPFVATYTVNTGTEISFLCYGVLCGFGGVLLLFLPETRGKKIIDTINDAYKHEDAAVLQPTTTCTDQLEIDGELTSDNSRRRR